MPECDYCGESFDDEDDYLDHLGAAHDEAELSRIDSRRVAAHGGGEGRSRRRLSGAVILAVLLVGAGGLVVYVSFFMGSTTNPRSAAASVSSVTPHAVGSVDEHGTINVTIEGRQVDFSRSRYQRSEEFPAFHFANGSGRVWHVHARNVTLEYAMATLGIGVNESAVSYRGLTYQDGDPDTTVVVEVDGEPVDPKTYVLRGAEDPADGDHVRIVVRRSE